MTDGNTESDDMICCAEGSEGVDMIGHCPMAERLDEIIGKSQLGLYLMIFGIMLVVLGVAIVVQPKILIWLVAAAATVMGIALLVAAYYINRMKSSLQS